MKEQLYHILEKLVVKNSIRLNQEELALQLKSHPSYPSLHSVTGVLDHFKINNLALKVPTTNEVLKQLPNAFMASVKIEHDDDVVLVEKKKTNLKVTVNAKKSLLLSADEFLSSWNGVVIAIEKDDQVEEYKGGRFKTFKRVLMILLGASMIVGFIFSHPNVFPIGHFVLSVVGLALSIFIVEHEFGMESTATNKFCNMSQNTSCDAILNSKGATIFGTFKLSDISITAFSGYILAWFIFTVMGIENFSLFATFSALAIPFAVFSIYYQYSVVKKWCPLCLGVVCVLTLQFATFFIGDISVSSISFKGNEVVAILSGFVLAIIIWNFMKSHLTNATSLKKLELEHIKFKRNYSIFESLYSQGKAVETSEEMPGEIVLGNDNAPIKLMLVTSPYCIFCKDAHNDLNRLLENKNINVTIRFLVGSDNKENDFYKIVSELLHTYHTNGKAATLLLLNELYKESIDLAQWVNDRNIHYNPGYDKIMDWQLKWCTDNGIGFTPALYLFDKPFPSDYDRKDLLLFTDELIENISHLATTSIESRMVS